MIKRNIRQGHWRHQNTIPAHSCRAISTIWHASFQQQFYFLQPKSHGIAWAAGGHWLSPQGLRGPKHYKGMRQCCWSIGLVLIPVSKANLQTLNIPGFQQQSKSKLLLKQNKIVVVGLRCGEVRFQKQHLWENVLHLEGSIYFEFEFWIWKMLRCWEVSFRISLLEINLQMQSKYLQLTYTSLDRTNISSSLESMLV